MSKAQQKIDRIQADIDERDYHKRIEEEQKFLALAKERGDFEFSMAERQINTETLIRTMAAALPAVQLKDECLLMHSGRVGKIALLGEVYKIPLSVLIGGGYIVYLVHHFFPSAAPVLEMVSGK